MKLYIFSTTVLGQPWNNIRRKGSRTQKTLKFSELNFKIFDVKLKYISLLTSFRFFVSIVKVRTENCLVKFARSITVSSVLHNKETNG